MPYVEVNPSEIQAPMGGFIPISEEEARKAKKPPSILAPAYETTKSMATVWGPLEVGAEMVSGIPAFVAGGITSGAEAVSGKKIPRADKLVEFLESPSIMYHPKTASGQQLEGALANIFITARETGQNVADVVLDKTGSPLLSTIIGTTVGGIPEILMAIAGIKRGLRPKVKAPGFVTEGEWAELKPKPEQIEFKPRVEVPTELQVKALPPGQGFVLLDKKPETILRSKPPKGKEVLISETGEPITPENIIPQELKTKALPPSQGFELLPEKPKTILRQPPPPSGRPVEISPTGEPIYPEGVKPVLGKLPLTEAEKMKAPVITKEGKTIGIKPEAKVEGVKPVETLKDFFKSGRKEITESEITNLPDVKSSAKSVEDMKVYLEGKGIKVVAKEIPVHINEIHELIEFVKIGEPGGRTFTSTRTENLIVGGYGSSYPPFMRNKGWTKVDVLEATRKGLAGEPFKDTIRKGKKLRNVQKEIWEAVNEEAKGIYRDRLEEQRIFEERKSLFDADPEFLKEDTIKNLTKSIDDEIMGMKEEWRGQGYSESEISKFVKETYKTSETEGIPTEVREIKEILAEPTKELKPEPSGLAILKSEKGAISLPTPEEIKRVTNRFREFWSLFSTLPQKESLLKARGEAFGGMARTERIVDHVIDLTKEFSDQAKKEMFEASDRSRRDINTLPPEQARVVKELITVKNIIGDGLVLRDMVPEEAVGKLKGQYIKFVYLKHLLGEDIEIPINPNGKINTNALKARKGLTLEQQKSIGLIEDISIADPLGIAQSLTNIVKYDYLEKLASDPRNVWEPSVINISDMPRKYSEPIAKAQATRLSRSTGDPHRAIQVGNDWQVMNLQNREFVGKKMGIGELNEEVDLYKKMVKANPNSPEIQQRLGIYERYLEQAKVATQNVPEDFIQMPTAKSWGPLAGTFIRKEVARDLMSFYGKERGNIQGLTKAIDALAGIDQMATGLFKIGKVPLNLPTVVRNTISNPIQLNMSGMNFADIIKNMVRTGEDFIKKPPTYTKAFRNGLFKTNWSVTEINEVMDQFRHLKGDTFADVVGAVKNLSKYYGKIDDFFKYTKLLDGLDNGLPFEKAIMESQKWVMDYSLADPSIKWARKKFIPFASYSYKIAPLVVESIIKRPWVIGKYLALPPAIMALTRELYKDEMTEDDWKTLEGSIPREVQRRQSFMIVPWKINDKWYWFDYSYFLPWGNYMNAISGISSGDIKAPLTQFGIAGTPLLTTLKTFGTALARNEPPKDSFSGQPLYNRIDEPIDRALKVSEYFYNLFAPSMVTRYGALGETLDIGKEDRYGRTVEAEQAIGKWFGVNLKEANPQLAAIIKKAKINALKDEYMKIMIDPKISTEKKERYAERFQEEISQIMGGKD